MRPYIKTIFIFITLFSVVVAGAWAGPENPSVGGANQQLNGPKAVFLETKYEFKPLFEGEDITHDFVVENRGDAPLVIKNVKPG